MPYYTVETKLTNYTYRTYEVLADSKADAVDKVYGGEVEGHNQEAHYDEEEVLSVEEMTFDHDDLE
jgi:hypothetical protein